MKLSNSTVKDFKAISISNFALTALANIVLVVFSMWSLPAFLGLTLGLVGSILSFYTLCKNVEQAVNRAPDEAQRYMSSKSAVRMLILVGLFLVAYNLDAVSEFYVVLPFLFTRLSIYIVSFLRRKEK